METNNINEQILDVQRFSIHDGPGIRTTVFIKGCTLKCLWCHNPESIDFNPEISYDSRKCIGCGYCIYVCPYKCHSEKDNKHIFNRENCVRCGLCTEECYAGALKILGVNKNIGDVLDVILRDSDYYIMSNGGVTISGGEPMAHSYFVAALLKAVKNRGINTCVDTSGYTKFENFLRIIDYTDIFLYDIKETNAQNHIKYTGVDKQLIMDNLIKLDKEKANIILRCPIIPGLNDRKGHFEKIAEIANGLKNILEINIMPYHPYGSYKAKNISKTYQLFGDTVKDSLTDKWIDMLKCYTSVPVKKG